jgi:hypothetical protein
MIRRTLSNRKNLSYVAWVAIGTGSVFLTLALPLPALGAFVVGAYCAYAGRSGRRDPGSAGGFLTPPSAGGVQQQTPPQAATNPANTPNEGNETKNERTTR